MTMWNKLLAALDDTFGFANKITSKVKKLDQGFDKRTREHVIWLEYRIKVRNVAPPKPDPRIFESERVKQEHGHKILDAIINDVLRDLHTKRS